MLVSENIIIGESVVHQAERILKAINLKETYGYIAWYGITTALENENLMYILSGAEMNHKVYYDAELTLLGLAGSRKEALRIVLNLVQQGYNMGNIYCMKQYLAQHF